MCSKIEIFPIIFFSSLIFQSCCLSISSKSHHYENHLAFKDNLEALNWTYGNITEADYRVRIFKTATTETISTCPLSTPYTNQNLSKCEACPSNTPLRNLGTYQCQECPTGSTYNTTKGNCSIVTSTINSTTVVPTVTSPTTTTSDNDQFYDDDYAPVIHPENQTSPNTNTNSNANISNTNASTSANTSSNTTNTTTITCPSEQEFFNGKCQPIIYIANPNAQNLIQPSQNYTQQQTEQIKNSNPNRSIQTCPESKPYLNGTQCVGCSNGQYYAINTAKCISGCPTGTIYNENNKTCEIGVLLTNPSSSGLLSTSNKFPEWKASIEETKSTEENAEYCSESAPFAANGRCITCPNETPYFNVDNSTCVDCQSGRYYSGDNKSCMSWYSDDFSLRRVISNIF